MYVGGGGGGVLTARFIEEDSITITLKYFK